MAKIQSNDRFGLNAQTKCPKCGEVRLLVFLNLSFFSNGNHVIPYLCCSGGCLVSPQVPLPTTLEARRLRATHGLFRRCW